MKKIPKIDKKYTIIIILMIVVMLAIVSAGTYALLTWESIDNTEVTMTFDDGLEVIPGPDIKISNIGPVFNYELNGVETNFIVANISSQNATVNSYIQISNISDNLKRKDFKFAVLRSINTEKTEYKKINEGDFSTASTGNKLYLFKNDTIDANNNVKYRIIFYIDGNVENPLSMMNNILEGTIYGERGEYGVEYFANGGVGTLPSKVTASYNQSVTLATNTLTNEGYTFVGWCTDPDCSGTIYNAGTSVSVNGYVRLYAKWDATDYTIKYFIGNTQKSTTTTCRYGEDCVLEKISSINGSNGSSVGDYWTFAGWTTSPSDASVMYEDGEEFEYKSRTSMNLYAIGEKSFSFYSGRTPTDVYHIEKQYWNTSSTATSNLTQIELPEPESISGWNFVGYRTGTDISASSSVTYANSLVETKVTPAYNVQPGIKSVYKRTLTLALNANGGVGEVNSLKADQYYFSGHGSDGVNSNESVSTPTFTLPSAGFTRNGYTQTGWQDTATTPPTNYNMGASYNKFVPQMGNNSTTKTLKANWQQNVYTINYYLGNGTSTAGNYKLGSSTCAYGEVCTLNSFSSYNKTFPGSSSGWEFHGWANANNSTETLYTDQAAFVYNTMGDINLYAIGKKEFKFNYGVNPSTTNSYVKVNQYWNPQSTATSYLSSILIPESPASSLSNYGWSFVGYRTDNTASTTVTYSTTDVGTNKTPAYNADPNIRGVYQRSVSVAYDANGGTGSKSDSATQIYNTGYSTGSSNSGATTSYSSFTVPSTGYSKSGYNLSGWLDETTNTTYNLGNSFALNYPIDSSSGRTLKAIWTGIEYTINYMSPNLLYGMENVSTTTADSGFMKYSITDGVITVTALQNDGYGFTNAKVDLVAGTEYSFSGTCSKTWGTNCEMFIMLESNAGNYIRVYNSTQTFTPTTTGTYLIRLDSNTNGDTVTFSNMSITKKLGTSKCNYGASCTLTSFSSLGGVIPHSSSDTLRTSRSWSFQGWDTSKTGVSSTVDYSNSASFTYLMTNDITLYPRARRKINFNSGIAPTTIMTAPYQYWNPIAFDNSNTTTVTLPTAISISSWSFLGYRIGSNKANDSVTFDSTKVGTQVYFPVAKSRTIRSVYERTLTLSFNKNGGSGTVSSLQKVQYYNSGYLEDSENTGANVSTPSFTLPAATAFTAPTGHSFGGWNTNSSGTGSNYTASSAYTGFAPAVDNTTVTKTLYAKWTPNTYTINYYLGNATSTAGSTLIATSTCTYDSNCTLTKFSSVKSNFWVDSNNKTHDWVFHGWATSDSTTTITYTDEYSFAPYKITSNLNLYAVGTRLMYFYSGTGPTLINSQRQYWIPTSTATSYLTSITVPAATSIGNNWTFIGYRSGENTANSNVTIAASTVNTTITPTHDAWNYSRSVYRRSTSLGFNANGGSGSTSSISAYQYFNCGIDASGATLTTPSFTLPANGFTAPTGYGFKGWGTSSTATTTYAASASYTGFKPAVNTTSTSKTMYAIWADTTPPTVALAFGTSVQGSKFGYKSLSIKATATDSGSGVSSIKTCTTTSTTCTPSTTGSNGVGTATFTSNVNKQKMCYEAKDVAGNTTGVVCDSTSYNVGITLYDYLRDNNVSGLHETYIGNDDLYRFSGTSGNTGINNYICLGTSTKCSVDSANMHRIIGVEPSTGNIKVIRRSSAGSAKWHTTIPSPEDLIWTSSSLFSSVKSTWYTNLDSNIKKYVVSHKWYIGKVKTGTMQSASNTRANAIANEEESSTTQYVGIMSVSDWLMSYRGDQNYWEDPGTTKLWIGLDNNGCSPTSSDKCHEWTMSRSYVWDATDGLAVWRTNPKDGGIGNYYTSNSFRYRPTYYIDIKTLYVSGSGTSSDPFMVDLAIAS